MKNFFSHSEFFKNYKMVLAFSHFLKLLFLAILECFATFSTFFKSFHFLTYEKFDS